MPTVGLVGSRRIEDELQSKTRQKFVTEFAFPKDSRTPNQISIPHEGANPNKNPEKLGDCYKCDVEDTSMCAPPPARFFSSPFAPQHTFLTHTIADSLLPFNRRLKFFFLSLIAMYGTYMLQYIQ